MSTFPPGSVRDRVARYGDLWISDGQTMSVTEDLHCEIRDEMVMQRCSHLIAWAGMFFSAPNRAFIGLDET